jgi:hypothetical protein
MSCRYANRPSPECVWKADPSKNTHSGLETFEQLKTPTVLGVVRQLDQPQDYTHAQSRKKLGKLRCHAGNVAAAEGAKKRFTHAPTLTAYRSHVHQQYAKSRQTEIHKGPQGSRVGSEHINLL